jgi:hypothetical protein
MRMCVQRHQFTREPARAQIAIHRAVGVEMENRPWYVCMYVCLHVYVVDVGRRSWYVCMCAPTHVMCVCMYVEYLDCRF